MTIPNAQDVIDSQGQKVYVRLPVEESKKFILESKRIETLPSWKKKLRNVFMVVGQIQVGEKEGQTLSSSFDTIS